MIQIEHHDIDNIVKKHYNFVYSDATNRLNFYIDLFDSLGNKRRLSKTTSICKYYGFSKDVTPRTLIDPFLKKKYRKTERKYNVSINQVESVFFSSSNYIIDNSLDTPLFRQLYNFFSSIKSELETLITGKPIELKKYTVDPTYKVQSNPLYKKCIENVLRYEEFTKDGFTLVVDIWNSYKLTSGLDISTCPYCNRNWINTVTTETGKKIVNPQLDHFFCKAKYPLLRLSFYNLIPSCDTCNTRLKRSDQFNLEEYLHPYIESYKGARFRATALNPDSAIGASGEYLITLQYDLIPPSNKDHIDRNNEVFRINEIYMKHGDIVSEIFRKKHLFSIRYLEILKNTISTYNLTYEEMYRIAFGNYFKDSDFKKRPFSKLTKDIAEQLGMIKV